MHWPYKLQTRLPVNVELNRFASCVCIEGGIVSSPVLPKLSRIKLKSDSLFQTKHTHTYQRYIRINRVGKSHEATTPRDTPLIRESTG